MKKRVFVFLIALIMIVSVSACGSNGAKNEETVVEETPQNTVTSAPPQHSDADNTADETPAQNVVDEVGEDGFTDRQRDLLLQESALWGVVRGAEYSYNTVWEKMEALENGGTLYDVYSACGSAKTALQNSWESTRNFEDMPNSDNYIRECQYYFNHMKGICENLQDYIDNDSMEALNDAQEAIQKMDSYSSAVVNERIKFYSSNGFSDEQIAQILSED